MKKSIKIFKKISFIFAIIITILVIIFAIFFISEFRPKQTQKLILNGNAKSSSLNSKEFKIITWNIGYASLGKNADFFMDGGKMVQTSTKNQMKNNLENIYKKIQQENADFIFLQEIDKKSKRSHFFNQQNDFSLKFTDYQSNVGTNFKVLYSPYPLHDTMGTIDSGIMTLSKIASKSATRVQLPCPFSFPVSMFNLKRCLIINRIPLANSQKELVLINFHLEAYDSGEGKIAQTKMLNQIFNEEINKGNFVIAGGDFNQTLFAEDILDYPVIDKNFWQPGKLDIESFGNQISVIRDKTFPTCRSLDKPYSDDFKKNFQFYVIDGFLVSANIKINSVQTKNYNFEWSDHNPVVMNFELIE